MFELGKAKPLVRTESIELFSGGLRLDCGEALAPVTVAYETYGSLNTEGSNAILICHALTASAHAAGYHTIEDPDPGWWNGLIGQGKAFDTEKYFVVCPNVLGSCYGTTGPTSINPKTGRRYGQEFPQITIRDIVRVQKELLDALGIKRLATVIGSSFGGMQVLEWGIMYPDFCETIIPISTAATQTAWCLALNSIARAAITSDPVWNNGNYTEQPAHGLTLARMLGMVTYRSPEEFNLRFGRERTHTSGDRFDTDNPFQVESYLKYQGGKLVKRFDANTYLCLSRALDLHDVGYERGGEQQALGTIRSRTLCIGVSSDQRYPTGDQKELVRFIPGSEYAEIQSFHGHDAFLIEYGQLNSIISSFLRKGETPGEPTLGTKTEVQRILYERSS